MEREGVKLLGHWASPYALRVKWALNLKGIEYEYHEEDLPNKSSLLLHSNLLPDDPYERAQARFWAKFADEKCVPAIMNTFSKIGEEQEKSAKEARENLKTLESGLNGKCCFGVEKIGFTDIAAAWIGCWGRIVEEIVNIKLIDEDTMPVLSAWFKYVLEDPILKECVPPYQKLLEHNKSFQKILLAAAST